jgi:error-prone DNA polymerase
VPHLHVHTHFSFGIGVSSPDVLTAAAAERGFAALACTDTNGVYGAVEFQRACEAAGVRPILGAHLVTDHEETVALATDERGWAALCRAITRIHWDGRSAGPVIPTPSGARGRDLLEHPGRAHRSGHAAKVPPPRSARGRDDGSNRLSTSIANDREGLILLSRDPAFLERVLRQSGPRDLYTELCPGKERHAVLAAARRLGLPVVATNAVVAAHPEDWQRHRLLRAIHLNTTLSALAEADRLPARPPARPPACPPDRLSPRDAWLRPTADLERQFPDCPEAIRAAEEIAERCRYRIPIGRVVAPRFADVTDAFQELRTLAYEGAERRYGTVAPVTRDRLEHELAIIGMKGFADYFLVVRDIVANGPTHCGRGSVANSIVSYCLGITHVEPLGAGLLFERFLNPERKDPPDIDLDFPWDERDNVLAYVFRRYPHPQAAMVANHNCFRLRGALREVAKVHGRPNGEIREVTSRIPWWACRATCRSTRAAW